MSDAVIAQKLPFMTDLEENKDYFWCSCGKSSNQPFCDGSHKGSGMAAVNAALAINHRPGRYMAT